MIVVGHSFGGRVGLRLAVNGKCDKLVLVDSAGLKPHRKLSYYIKVYGYKLKKKLGINTDNCGSQDYCGLSPIMKRTFVNIVNTYQDKELASVKIPTLIIWGRTDSDTPLYMAKKYHKYITNSRLIVYSEGGHFCYLAESDRFIMNLRSFCG